MFRIAFSINNNNFNYEEPLIIATPAWFLVIC